MSRFTIPAGLGLLVLNHPRLQLDYELEQWFSNVLVSESFNTSRNYGELQKAFAYVVITTDIYCNRS